MIDPNTFLGDLLSSPTAKGALGGVAGGALAGILVNKKARKALGKTAVQAGGIAAIAGVAYYAYRKLNAPQATAAAPTDEALVPPPADTPFLPPASDVAGRHDLGMKLIRAMIAAAKADGTMDAGELKTVIDTVEASELAADDKSEILRALNETIDVDTVAAMATCPEVAAEIYGASLTAIDLDTPAEQVYHSMLASKLGLSREMVVALHEAAETPAPL